MATVDALHKRLRLNRHELIAILCAISLSLGALLRGAVDDVVIAILLVFYIPLLWLAAPLLSNAHSHLRILGYVLFGSTIFMLGVQYAAHGHIAYELLSPVRPMTELSKDTSFFIDHYMWLRGISKTLWFIVVYCVALAVGTSESASRLFFGALLVSGVLLLSLTFFSATSDGIPTASGYAYSHGFINANNAAAYIALLMLIALAQSARFFRLPTKSDAHQLFLDLFDKVSLESIIKGGFLIYSLMLSFVALLMTGSRAGITLAVLASGVFIAILLKKLSVDGKTRRYLLALTLSVLTLIVMWCFLNFGHIIGQKLLLQGSDTNSRLDIYQSAIRMVYDHPLLGVSLGGFAALFPQYRGEEIIPDGIIDKAHNSYLEFTIEMGIPLAIICLIVLAQFGRMLYLGTLQRKERYVIPALGFVLWLYAGLFSLIDFPLQIPANAALFLAIIVVCASQTDPRYSSPAQNSSKNIKRVRIRKRRSAIKI